MGCRLQDSWIRKVMMGWKEGGARDCAAGVRRDSGLQVKWRGNGN